MESQNGEWEAGEVELKRWERPRGREGTRCRSSLAGAGNAFEGVRERSLERQVPGRLAALGMPGCAA